MITWSDIVQKIKEEISFPFQQLEKSDEEIIDYLKRNALRKFTFYFPQEWRMPLDCDDESLRVPNRHSEYYLIEPDDREIKTISDIHYSSAGAYMSGHPIMGPFTTSEVSEWHLQTFNSNMVQPFSNYNYTHEFIPPNMLRISPQPSGTVTIVYERSHDPELSTIRPEFEDLFMDLCQGMFFMQIGSLRQKFNSMTTPFGEIQLNGDFLYNSGKELYDRVIEKCDNSVIPNVIFDAG